MSILLFLLSILIPLFFIFFVVDSNKNPVLFYFCLAAMIFPPSANIAITIYITNKEAEISIKKQCAEILVNKNILFTDIQESFNSGKIPDVKALQIVNKRKNIINDSLLEIDNFRTIKESVIVSAQDSVKEVWKSFLQIKSKDDYKVVIVAMDDLNTNITRICPNTDGQPKTTSNPIKK